MVWLISARAEQCAASVCIRVPNDNKIHLGCLVAPNWYCKLCSLAIVLLETLLLCQIVWLSRQFSVCLPQLAPNCTVKNSIVKAQTEFACSLTLKKLGLVSAQSSLLVSGVFWLWCSQAPKCYASKFYLANRPMCVFHGVKQHRCVINSSFWFCFVNALFYD